MSNLGSEFALDFSSKNKASSSLLKYHREISSLSLEELSIRTSIPVDELESFESDSKIPTSLQLENIANAFVVNIRDLLPNDKVEKKVIITQNDKTRSWFFPENKKFYKFHELASTTALPFSKSFKVDILNSTDPSLDLRSGLHQYVYNIGQQSVVIHWQLNDKIFEQKIEPNDSIYIKPFIKHNFRGTGNLLILRVGGKIPGDSQRELSIVGKNNAQRAISETMLWFDKTGKN
tara:strand:- start:723 stop:1424 length:702 start_codon:yes stop_codon:yes gene_type:complete